VKQQWYQPEVLSHWGPEKEEEEEEGPSQPNCLLVKLQPPISLALSLLLSLFLFLEPQLHFT
jgi:hypothetical protein